MATSRQLVDMAGDLGTLAARVQLASDSIRQGDFSHDEKVRDTIDSVENLLASCSKRILRALGRLNALYAADTHDKDPMDHAQRTSER